jgi:hypothetical protein
MRKQEKKLHHECDVTGQYDHKRKESKGRGAYAATCPYNFGLRGGTDGIIIIRDAYFIFDVADCTTTAISPAIRVVV